MPSTASGQPRPGKKEPSGDEGFFQQYPRTPEQTDEVFAPDGSIKSHWKPFLQGLHALGKNEFSSRWHHTSKLLHEQGVPFNVLDDSPRKPLRSWNLDPIPLVLSTDDWKILEKGISQRIQLLNLILHDVYGAQQVLTEGLVPPAVILGNPHFLRPCHGFQPSRNWFIHLLGADVFRNKDGSWGLLADRTQKPAGIGEALENRLFISQMLLELFHENRTQQLGRFCHSLQETLASIAPRNRDNPYIVLLTSGPSGKTYLEDASFARYMGYPLVESGDLTVRNNLVYFKTLSGLHPVDVIFRRVNDHLCDPLSIRSDVVTGIPGLLESIRANKVAVANALGSSLVETPALIPFLPALCRRFLSEDLLLQPPPTSWLGSPEALQKWLGNPDQYLIKSAFSKSSSGILSTKSQNKDQNKDQQRARQDLIDQVKARPFQFVAQQEVPLSTLPTWSNGKISPGFLLLRMFAVCAESSFPIMPGGFARTSPDPEALWLSQKSGLNTKDTWIPAPDVQVVAAPERLEGTAVEITRGGKDLQSRVADNYFWLGRYLERVESIVRIFRSVLMRLAEENEFVSETELPTLLNLLVKKGVIAAAVAEKPPLENLDTIESEFQKAMFDEKQPGSLKMSFLEARRVALLVKDRLASDTWRVIRRLEKCFTLMAPSRRTKFSEVLEIVNEAVMTLSAFSGLSMENITRSYDWRFLDIGRRVERALQTIEMLQTSLIRTVPKERSVLEAILEVGDSSMTYRARYRASLQPAPVLDLLLTDEINPRSVAFQAVAINQHMEQLPKDAGHPFLTPEQKTIFKILGFLRLAEVKALVQVNAAGERALLAEVLEDLDDGFLALSDYLSRHYFIHVQPSQQLSSLKP